MEPKPKLPIELQAVIAMLLIQLVSSQPYNVYEYAINTPYNSTL